MEDFKLQFQTPSFRLPGPNWPCWFQPKAREGHHCCFNCLSAADLFLYNRTSIVFHGSPVSLQPVMLSYFGHVFVIVQVIFRRGKRKINCCWREETGEEMILDRSGKWLQVFCMCTRGAPVLVEWFEQVFPQCQTSTGFRSVEERTFAPLISAVLWRWWSLARERVPCKTSARLETWNPACGCKRVSEVMTSLTRAWF